MKLNEMKTGEIVGSFVAPFVVAFTLVWFNHLYLGVTLPFLMLVAIGVIISLLNTASFFKIFKEIFTTFLLISLIAQIVVWFGVVEAPIFHKKTVAIGQN